MGEYAKQTLIAERKAKKAGVVAPSANPLGNEVGSVKPTSPFGGMKAPELPANPFGGVGGGAGGQQPAAAAAAAGLEEEIEDEFSNLSPVLARRMRMEKQLAAENAA